MAGAEKAPGAFRTIGELSAETGIAQHILRYWESRFAQLRPLQRAGKRRYYRPEDAALVRQIDQWLNRDGYTVRGVQQLLSGGAAPILGDDDRGSPAKAFTGGTNVDFGGLDRIRSLLVRALAEDA